MLKKTQRLKSFKQIGRIYQLKRSVANPFLILYAGVAKKDENIETKITFVISKKIDKRAVKRNLIKRRLREAYTIINPKINLEDMIIISRPPILNASFEEIKTALEDILDKAQKRFIN